MRKYSSILQQVLLPSLLRSPGAPLVLSFLFSYITLAHTCGIQYFCTKISCDYPENKFSYHLWRCSACSSVNMRWNSNDPRSPYIIPTEWLLLMTDILFFTASLILYLNGLLVTNTLKPEPEISVKVRAAFRLPIGPFRASSTAEQGSKPSSSNQN